MSKEWEETNKVASQCLILVDILLKKYELRQSFLDGRFYQFAIGETVSKFLLGE